MGTYIMCLWPNPGFGRIWNFSLWWGLCQVFKNLYDWKTIFHDFTKYLVLYPPCISQCIGFNWHALMSKVQNKLGVQRVKGCTEQDDVRIVYTEAKDPEPNNVPPLVHLAQSFIRHLWKIWCVCTCMCGINLTITHYLTNPLPTIRNS